MSAVTLTLQQLCSRQRMLLHQTLAQCFMKQQLPYHWIANLAWAVRTIIDMIL
jgi:hypothetical protein